MALSPESIATDSRCPSCGQARRLRKVAARWRWVCRFCARLQNAAYRQTEQGRAAKVRGNAKYFAKPETKFKQRARVALGKAIDRGQIVRPQACERCGSLGRVEGHHHKGYEREHWFDVKWLCSWCHADEEAAA